MFIAVHQSIYFYAAILVETIHSTAAVCGALV